MLNKTALTIATLISLSLLVPLAHADVIAVPISPYLSSGIVPLIFAFVITVILEFLVVWAFIRKDIRKVLLYEFLINLFTWPLATVASYLGANLLLIELVVVILEGILIKHLFDLKYPKSFVISIVANVVSAFLGLFILLLIGL